MNWLDIAVILTIAGLTLAAYSAGLIREVMTTFAVIIGIVVASLLYERLARDVLVFVDDEGAAEAVSFLALFGAVYLFGQIGAYVLKTGAALLMLGPLDHMGGAVFGFVKGILVVQTLLLTVVILVTFGTLSSCGDDTSPPSATPSAPLSSSPTATRSVGPSETATPSLQTPGTVMGIGEMATVDGIALTLSGVEGSPTTPAGTIDLTLGIEVKNTGTNDFLLSPTESLLIRGTHGEVFQPRPDSAEGLAREIGPGETISGEITYDVQGDAYPLLWVYVDDNGLVRVGWRILPLEP